MVFGQVNRNENLWYDNLGVHRSENKLRAFDGGNLSSHSTMALIKQYNDIPKCALIQLKPTTGRTHQLRIQCAKRFIPIIGDNTYGDFKLNHSYAKMTGKKRLHLHLSYISFSYVFNNIVYNFSAESQYKF